MGGDDGDRRPLRGGAAGHGHGGQWWTSKTSVVLLAIFLCVLNLYMYLSPATGTHNKAAAGGGAGGGSSSSSSVKMQQGAAGASSFVVKPADKQQVESSKWNNKDKDKKAATAQQAAAAAGSLADRTVRRDQSRKKNVLFLMTDDLRPSLSIYDKPVVTPAFERLAKGSVVFERAYNQDPICNPSRNSLLSGRRPDTARTWLFENTVPHGYSNIFKYFKDEGKYKVYGTGKLWHWTR